MGMRTIQIGDKEYDVTEPKTKEDFMKGLQGVKELPEDEGMLFDFGSPRFVSMWMKDTHIPLDIIYINDDKEVIFVAEGIPESEKQVSVSDTRYVLEVNKGSGVRKGDELILDDEEEPPVMKVLAPDGSTQLELWGGERIFSRKNTIVLIRKAKKADKSKDDKDYMALGRYMFKCIKGQDERKPEYVDIPQ